MAARIRRRMAATLRYRSIKGRAQSAGAERADSMAHSILRCRKGPGANFGLNPLGGIGCQFNFHSGASFDLNGSIVPQATMETHDFFR